MSRRPPEFDAVVGDDLPDEERRRLRRVHDLLAQADAPPELGPDLEAVPWPEEALTPLPFGARNRTAARGRSRLLLAAAVAAVALMAFLLGHATAPEGSFHADRVVQLRGTALDRGALATLEVGKRDPHGNWPMVLHVRRLAPLPKGGYYDLYLTRHGKPLALCGSFNIARRGGDAKLEFTAGYELARFDRNGWVVTRQMPGHHEPTDIVLRPTAGA